MGQLPDDRHGGGHRRLARLQSATDNLPALTARGFSCEKVEWNDKDDDEDDDKVVGIFTTIDALRALMEITDVTDEILSSHTPF